MGAGYWGVQPSGFFVNAPRNPRPRRGAMVKTAVTGTPQATGALPEGLPGPLGALLPRPATLDYVHKFTTTTLLVLGVVGYLLFGRKSKGVLRQLASRHVARP